MSLGNSAASPTPEAAGVPNRVIVAGEYRLFRGPDGMHYAESVVGYSFWCRYLEAFDEVVVAARVAPVADVSAMLRVTGPHVTVAELPYFIGLAGYLKSWPALRRAVRRLARHDDNVILRVPGSIGTALASALRRGRPYGVEVVGDPAEVFAKGAVEPPMRSVVRIKAMRDLRRLCRRARAVAYVSRYQLEDRYPASPKTPTFEYSSASMPPAAYVNAPRIFTGPLRSFITIGSMDQMYKGFDTLLQAFANVLATAQDLKLTIVGGGRHEADLQRLAADLGVAHAVDFSGVLRDPAQVRARLDSADLFLSSSRTEGLPRAVIEAQARAVPCVGTRVGGTPELLREQDMCAPDDVAALTRLIASRRCDPDWACEESRRGLEQASRYAAPALQAERNRMFAALLLARGRR